MLYYPGSWPYGDKMAEFGAEGRPKKVAAPKNIPDTGAGQQGAAGNLTGAGALLAQIVSRGNPYVTAGLAGLKVAGGLFDYFHTSDQEERLQGIYDDLWERRRRLMDESQGIFSSARQQQILEGNEGQLNAVSAQLAAAGLGTSGAGASVLAEVTSDTFRQAQQDAFAQLDVTEKNIITIGEKLASEIPSLGGIFSNLLQGVAALGGAESVPEIADFMKLIGLTGEMDGAS